MQVSEVYPDGASCLHCGKHIEVDTSFILLLIGALITLMILDFRFWGTGFVGLPAAAALIGIGVFLKSVYANFMPLRHYPDTSS